jgi:hypothetical protein
MPKLAAGIANHRAELEFDRFKMRINPFAAGRRQGVEQLIAALVMIRLRFGHLPGANCPFWIRSPLIDGQAPAGLNRCNIELYRAS